MKYAIITGGSKGIGNGLALVFKSKGYAIRSLARSTNDDLAEGDQVFCDLSNHELAEEIFVELLNEIVANNPSEVLLINNAGTLGTVDRLEENSADSIASALSLNVTIPMALSGLFIKTLEKESFKKEIINISSGAAANPYYGWSVYCASKAAVDMFTKVTAIEQETAEHPTRVLSIYPGIVDTNMQVEIRSKNERQFANVERFVESKEQNLLATPIEAAESVYKLYSDANLKSGSITDVRVLAES